MQRLLDVVFSAVALVLLSPVLLLVMVVLRLTGEGEVFFVQKRVGLHGREFGIYKFATMLKNSPHTGAGTVTVKDDPRILPVGKLLRKTKINELPQLFNILTGDMSFVGPRPLVRKGFDAFDEETKRIVQQLKPGLSGIGSLVFRNEEEILQSNSNQVDFYYQVIAPYKGELERWYYQNCSLLLYFKIIFATALLVLKPDVRLVYSLFGALPPPSGRLATQLLGAGAPSVKT